MEEQEAGSEERGWDRKVHAMAGRSASELKPNAAAASRRISDSVAYFISPISTGLDRKARLRPQHNHCPVRGAGQKGRTCVHQLPTGAVAYLYSAGSI